MKLTALLVTTGIVMVPCIAHAQSTARAVQPSKSCTQSGSTITLNVSVLNLTSGFDPKALYLSNPQYKSPQADSTITVTSTSAMGQDFANAFSISPPFFQQQLCDLDAVYVNPTGCKNFDSTNVCTADGTNPIGPQAVTQNSWGFREGPRQLGPNANTSHFGRYISISAGPWSKAKQSAPTFSKYEQTLLEQLLPWPSGATIPQYQSAQPSDTSGLAVLAALAHEFGHVLWYDTFRPIAGGPYDFDTFCRGRFFKNSWRHVDPPPFWREFSAAQNEHEANDISIVDIIGAVALNNSTNTNNALHKVFAKEGRWGSLFASLSPDEDFVETFKLYVLTFSSQSPNFTFNSLLTSLPIPLVGSTADDIPKDLLAGNKPELTRKGKCFDEILNPSKP